MALNGDIQILGDPDLTGGCLAASVAGNANELDARRGADGARQVRQEYERTLENRDQINGAFRIVGADLIAHGLHAFLNLLGGEENARDQSHALVRAMGARNQPGANLRGDPGAEPSASGTDMDVGRGGLAGNGMRESVVGDLVNSQILTQPNAFRLAGIDSHIHAAAVIE